MAKQPREPRIDAKLKRAPKELQRELWELRNPPDPEQKPLSFDELQVEVPRIFGFTASAGALSDWLAWYGLQLRMEHAEERKQQALLALAKDANLSPEALAKVGNVIFMAEAMEKKDLKGFFLTSTLLQGEKKIAQKDRGLKQKDTALEHEARRIAVLEKKAAQADQAQGVMGDGALSPDEKQARLKQIFGMG